MNTISQIENALKAINQANFQNLITHLLYLQGHNFVGAPGAMTGKEKTSKGTPDSFFVHSDKYIFVESTTKEKLGESKSFFEKLCKDVDHCFQESVTKIPDEKIVKIILACTEKISAAEHRQLNDLVKSHNHDAELEVLNIQNLPLQLMEIPKLVEEYLDIQIVKGDIYTLEQFLLKTGKGLQPSLTNEFIGREEEIKDCLGALQRYNVLLLSGGAGVGKSKLGVNILEKLAKEGYIPIVIQSSGVSLWDDYAHLFHSGKQHIILFDDANKSVTNLVYLLSKLDAATNYSAKVIITSRDYVKKQVSATLENHPYKELIISEFKDEDIEKIIVAALPNLQNHYDIKRKIVNLAKGNARIALMATFSVTPGAEINYLSSPVLLYEKYFTKIADELRIFDKPIILKSLAIVSFFGVLDRNNSEMQTILASHFGIDWNELWSAVIELHNHEILDVYADEIVKVSDQVMATYAFYKCFIDQKDAVINYAEWVTVFIKKYQNRIRVTLVDVNNTFEYSHVKALVTPHLNDAVQKMNTDGDLYMFYDLFWFYKGRECLLYLRKWIDQQPSEEHTKPYVFSFTANDHSKASAHFDLLKRFWVYPNELFKPSFEMTLQLLDKQPRRLTEIMKFIDDDLKYRIDDIDNGYARQNYALDILLSENISDNQKLLSRGIFLDLAKVLLGWSYTEFGGLKGSAFTVRNFNLYKSDSLLRLRKRLIDQVSEFFDPADVQVQNILSRVIYPGGDVDKAVYVAEIPIYEALIKKLDTEQLLHCRFVSALAKNITAAGAYYPKSWKTFTDSEISKLSKFLRPASEKDMGKSWQESEEEKRKEFEEFINAKDWDAIELFLLNIDQLYRQQTDGNVWHIESAITDIYHSILKKGKKFFEKALRLFFSGKTIFPLRVTIITEVVREHNFTVAELLAIINDFEFNNKPYWLSVLLAATPEEQASLPLLKLLIEVFRDSENAIYVNSLADYLKYNKAFEEFKKENLVPENHNIIPYLAELIQNSPRKTRFDLGFTFFEECASYFTEHSDILKEAYWAQHKVYQHFDYDSKALKAVLDVDRNFINDGLKNGKIGFDFHSPVRLENIDTGVIWTYPEYEELIEDMFVTIVDKNEFISLVDEDIHSLFKFQNPTEELKEKAKALITKLTAKYYLNEKVAPLLVDIVFDHFRDWFIEYFRQFLLLNKDLEMVRRINFGRGESWSGSRVPLIQKKMEFYQEVVNMINTLPGILEYSGHIDYFEQKIDWKKKDITEEQKRDFREEFY